MKLACAGTVAWLLLCCVAVSRASLTARHHAEPHQHKDPKDFGSYIVTCNGTAVTFYNFADSPSCDGAYTFYSSPLNECALESIPFVPQNLSWNALCNSTHMWYTNYADQQCDQGFLTRVYNLGGCYACPNKECKDADQAPVPVFGSLGGEAPWFENQWHTDAGAAFVTSMNTGAVYRGTYDATSDCVTGNACNVSHQVWLYGFLSTSGIVVDATSRTAFALVTLDASVQANKLISFALDTPFNYTVVVDMPDELNLFGNLTLNGLARHDGHGDVFYATSLGNFSAGNGAVFAIDTKAKKVTTVATGLTAADGAYVFKGMLYVSEVFAAVVHVFNVSDPMHPVAVTSYSAPGLLSLDDFFVHDLGKEDAYVFGADWVAGHVVSWLANGTSNSSRIHAAGLLHPTSVRPEVDADGQWRSDFVTVTQGGTYPATGRGVNGGAIYRLKLKDLPKPIHSVGSLVRFDYAAGDCSSKVFTGTSWSLEECIPQTATNTSMIVSCGLLEGATKRVFQGLDCAGASQNTTSAIMKCESSGTASYLEMCAAL